MLISVLFKLLFIFVQSFYFYPHKGVGLCNSPSDYFVLYLFFSIPPPARPLNSVGSGPDWSVPYPVSPLKGGRGLEEGLKIYNING
jgi:hypothetical protein